MARIQGVDLPDHQQISYALRGIYGVGLTTAQRVVDQAKINPASRVKDLTREEINQLQRLLDTVMTEGELRRTINDNIQRLKRIKSYRGLRHTQQLPVRGQRTRTNARSSRGQAGRRRATVGAMSKDMAAKTDGTKK